jgi:class 3 adenylate cyclase
LQVEDEIKKRENAETQLTLLHQQKQIAEFNLQTKNRELEGQRKTKQNFIIGGALLLALALALLALYLSKKRDHKKLGQAYGVLEDTKSKLSMAEENIRKLLRQQVSEDIAKELMTGGTSLSTKKSFVCVMFLDIRDFTSWAEKRDPEEIIKYQNKIFGFMIDLVNEFNGNINQLLGDGFMATFGAPISGGNDCQNAFNAALKIIENLSKNKEALEIENTKIGIGLHAGYVVTGNVGTELRKQYSITGNTVILASRIEQLNKKFGSQLVISREVHDKLEHFNGEVEFKKVIVKGRKTPIEVLTVA